MRGIGIGHSGWSVLDRCVGWHVCDRVCHVVVCCGGHIGHRVLDWLAHMDWLMLFDNVMGVRRMLDVLLVIELFFIIRV